MAKPAVPISADASTRVLCVDDGPDMTAMLRLNIESDPAMRCVGCLASADHLLDEVRRQNPPPDVVLLDATMPGKDPLEALRELDAAFPRVRTIILSGDSDAAFIDRVFAAGAWGYVSKGDEPGTVLQAVRAVAKGNVWRPLRPHGR
ncbi:MAG: response regulator transcription factor [Phycisphaerales bacterium]|nr:response regulator transcription factor [Phycisphaerales bacterium]